MNKFLHGMVPRTCGRDTADVNLTVDTYTRTFADSIPLTAQAQTLPDMQGSGMVRDLREAASIQTAAGRTLAAKLSQFAQATNRQTELAMLDDLISAWGNTTGFANMRVRAKQQGLGDAANDAVFEMCEIAA